MRMWYQARHESAAVGAAREQADGGTKNVVAGATGEQTGGWMDAEEADGIVDVVPGTA